MRTEWLVVKKNRIYIFFAGGILIVGFGKNKIKLIEGVVNLVWVGKVTGEVLKKRGFLV